MVRCIIACVAVSALLTVATSAGAPKVALNQEKKANVNGIGNPVGQVITLMKALQNDMVKDGQATASAYVKTAQTCKDSDASHTVAINKDNNKIAKLAGEIQVDFTEKAAKQNKITERLADQKSMEDALTAEVLRCNMESAEYEANSADGDKAIASLKKAVDQMAARTGQINKVSLLQVFDGALPKKSAVAADPAYKYHGNEINAILAKMSTSFKDEKKTQDEVWAKTKKACGASQTSIAAKMKTNMDAMTAAKARMQVLQTEISKDRSELVKTNTKLATDAKLLKTTTTRCENAANEFDRRANIQKQVLAALTQVMKFLGQTQTSGTAADTSAGKNIAAVAGLGNRLTGIKDAKTKRRDDLGMKKSTLLEDFESAAGVSFLQVAPIRAVTNFLAKGSSSTQTEQVKMDNVISLVRDESVKLSSPELSLLAMDMAGPNHFKGVEAMIHNLIVRLNEEKFAEISKNNFCTEEVRKANKNRDLAKAQADSSSADLSTLESKKERIEGEIKDMTKELADDNTMLTDLKRERTETRAKNLETIKKTKEGIVSLDKAITFYEAAAGAQADVAEESTPQAGTDEETLGTGAKGITALLSKITSDFDNMVSETEEADKADEADFQKSKNALLENIADKNMETKMDTQDLKSTNDDIAKTLKELQTQMGFMKNNLKVVADLKPVCLDAGGMNFNDRKNKRDEEIAALNKALTSLKTQ